MRVAQGVPILAARDVPTTATQGVAIPVTEGDPTLAIKGLPTPAAMPPPIQDAKVALVSR